MKPRLQTVLAVSALFAAVPAAAQTGSIAGRVRYAEGVPVRGARVTILSTDGIAPVDSGPGVRSSDGRSVQLSADLKW